VEVRANACHHGKQNKVHALCQNQTKIGEIAFTLSRSVTYEIFLRQNAIHPTLIFLLQNDPNVAIQV
jgi:hypothetical protein